jgi:hypothetical protein
MLGSDTWNKSMGQYLCMRERAVSIAHFAGEASDDDRSESDRYDAG